MGDVAYTDNVLFSHSNFIFIQFLVLSDNSNTVEYSKLRYQRTENDKCTKDSVYWFRLLRTRESINSYRDMG